MKEKMISKLPYLYIPITYVILGGVIIYLFFINAFNTLFSVQEMISSNNKVDFSLKLGDNYTEPNVDKDCQVSNIDRSLIDWPSYGDKYANISCDKIGLDASIYFGDNEQILRKGIGQYYGSSPFGYGKKILLSGHSSTYFAPLQYIKKGDVIKVKTSYGIYEYKVYKIKILNNDTKKGYEDVKADKEKLIMYTCYPFSLFTGTTDERLFVYAKKILGPNINKDAVY